MKKTACRTPKGQCLGVPCLRCPFVEAARQRSDAKRSRTIVARCGRPRRRNSRRRKTRRNQELLINKKIINHSIHFRYLLLIRYLIQDDPQKTDEQDRRGGEMDGFSSRPNCKTEGGRKMLLGRNQNKDLAGGETGRNGGFCRRSVTILLQFLICFFPAVIVQYDIIRSQSGSGGNK